MDSMDVSSILNRMDTGDDLDSVPADGRTDVEVINLRLRCTMGRDGIR
jgi:hypothetical protein